MKAFALHDIEHTVKGERVRQPAGAVFETTSDDFAEFLALGAVRTPKAEELAAYAGESAFHATKSPLDHDGDGKAGGSKPKTL